MDEMGLAAQQMQGQQGGSVIGIEQVLQMLQEGATPEQLLQMGIPQDVIAQAIEMLNVQVPTQAPEGLAGMHSSMNM